MQWDFVYPEVKFTISRLFCCFYVCASDSVTGDGTGNVAHEVDADPTTQRELSSKSLMNSKMKLASYSEPGAGDGSENDSGFIGQVVQRLPGSGSFPVGNLPMPAVGEHALFGGQMISPTHPQGPVQYMQPQVSSI